MKIKQNGFTFVEIMIVIAIISILASIALPAYNNYISKARATDATSTLADMRIRMEQYFQDNRSYANGPCNSPASANTTYFTFGCTSAASGLTTTYTLRATGIGAMTGWNYNVNETNTKSSDTPGASGVGCWSTSKSGTC